MERKLEGDLALQVTDVCNMNCDICLRGPSRKRKISKEIIDATLNKYSYITQLTFTGGEPTLNMEAIKYTIKRIKETNLRIGGFYIVTNAKFYCPELILALLELYAYCDEKYVCGLAVSVDEYHDPYDETAYEIYSQLPFFVTEKEHHNGWTDDIINRGNALINGYGTYDKEVLEFDPEYAECYDGEIRYDGIMYVNSRGYVFFDCDLSYEMQDKLKNLNVLKDNIADWMYKKIVDFNDGFAEAYAEAAIS